MLVALPHVAIAVNQAFYLDLVRRAMILAIAPASLNLILGYGGLVSFGHAAYLGIGGYAVGILAFHGIHDGWLPWGCAIAASAVVAAAIGAISIRTSGVYFIMITLAFTQMLYYLAVSLAEYGGHHAMLLAVRSRFPFIDLADSHTSYYVALAIMALCVFLVYRIVNSRFGMAL